MTRTELRDARAELDLVRRRRELFFWTVEMTLAVIVLIGMTIAFLAWLIHGDRADVGTIAAGAGITGVSAGGGELVGALRRGNRCGGHEDPREPVDRSR